LCSVRCGFDTCLLRIDGRAHRSSLGLNVCKEYSGSVELCRESVTVSLISSGVGRLQVRKQIFLGRFCLASYSRIHKEGLTRASAVTPETTVPETTAVI
jgi:hypothetical protein